MSPDPVWRIPTMATSLRRALVLLILVLGGCSRSAPDDVTNPSSTLEFRIIANFPDDTEAITATWLLARDDPGFKKELDALAQAGKPPPAPTLTEKREFDTPFGPYAYSWVEMSSAYRRLCLLDPTADGDPRSIRELGEIVAEAREQREPVILPGLRGLLFSRECRNQALSDEARAAKQFEYFLLCREPRPDETVTGADLEHVAETVDPRGKPAFGLSFSKAGAERLSLLTRRNKPTSGPDGHHHRYLAFILNGQIMTSPRLTAEFSSHAMIEGNFTQSEVQMMVSALRTARASRR